MKKTTIVKIVVVCLAIGLISGPVVNAEDHPQEKQGIERMKYYVDFMVYFIDIVDDSTNAIGMAQHGLKDMYMEMGQPQKAAEMLEQAILIVPDPKKRNVIRFTLADVYRKMQQHDKAREHLMKIIAENAVLN
ncbi:MAG: tetratricopeptide repeat protein [Candidatus Omnitrophica bacterium]|nr:tetratricopeptide repeat protein [Candidatus Omnitrophota bacterium]